jgi:hypothetical protein
MGKNDRNQPEVDVVAGVVVAAVEGVEEEVEAAGDVAAGADEGSH